LSKKCLPFESQRAHSDFLSTITHFAQIT
jgi:hypothetical protein